MARREKKTAPSGAVMGVPARNLMEYVKFFQKNDLRELTIREKGTTISLKKDEAGGMAPFAFASAPAAAVPASAAAAGPAPAVAPVELADDRYEKITTPIIGTYYDAPAPGAEPFVKEGQAVSKGSPVGIVEAMKVMNKISAEFDCKIVKKVAKNAQALKSGDVLFLVEKT